MLTKSPSHQSGRTMLTEPPLGLTCTLLPTRSNLVYKVLLHTIIYHHHPPKPTRYITMGSTISESPSQSVSLVDRFSAFNISTHTYKVVDGYPILVDVLIPKSLATGGNNKTKAPVSVRIHGGWLVRYAITAHKEMHYSADL